ncbi:hypothetical protein [Micromonospora zamorensis]|uniref:hypothetical protein n=1 Tax=Micromonospora zamorensis TaxID=709883 RepID=UPI0033ACBAC4
MAAAGDPDRAETVARSITTSSQQERVLTGGPAPVGAAVLVDDHGDAGRRIRLGGECRDLRPGQGRPARGHRQRRTVAAFGQGDGLQRGTRHHRPAGALRLLGEAQQIIAERLADRGVRVDPEAGGRPENVAWLSDQLDRAAVNDAPESRPDPADGRADPEDGGRRRTARQRQEEMAIHVRAVWSPERAERVIGSPAWPALAYKLDQLEQAGHDVRDLLRQVPGFVDRAHTPAAYAFRVVDDYAADVDHTAGHQGEADSQPAPERTSVTLEGEWRDTGGAAEDHVASGSRSDARAAHLAAQGFPSSTRSVVAAAAASPTVDAPQRRAGPGAQAASEAAPGR